MDSWRATFLGRRPELKLGLAVQSVWTNPPGFDKIAQRFWTTCTRRPQGEARSAE